jgi:hypothetical protein
MKKYLFTFSIMLALAACGEKTSEDTSAADSSAAENARIIASTAQKEQAGGTWKASVRPGSNAKTKKLVVTGNIMLKDSTAKPKLTRSKPQGAIELGELILTLSHEPAGAGKPLTVTYDEQISRPDRFGKVTIKYQDRTLAEITPDRGGKAE